MHARKLRDPVHKDILLAPLEVAALDTAQMQRLRSIRQLGAAYYVYPGAQHSRFEHCLGTCWMAKRIVERIESAGGFRFPEVHKQAIYLAALVHDVTHIPFGHTFEDERRLLERHDRSENRYELLLNGGELGDCLRGSEPGRLALRVLSPLETESTEPAYLRDIVTGTIGADLLDYLRRDNYYCGLSYEFDDRLLHYFRILDGRLALDMQQGGLFRRDALSEVTNLLRIRYVLSERVYYHHAKVAAGVMISKAVERALDGGLSEADLCRFGDQGLLYELRSRFPEDPALAELVDGFSRRRLFKRVYMLSRCIGEPAVRRLVDAYHLNRAGQRAEAERRIAEAVGSDPHRVAIYCAPAGMALKEADVPVIVPPARVSRLSDLNHEETELLKRQHQALWKLYVFVSPELAERADRAASACEELFGYPNELPIEKLGGAL